MESTINWTAQAEAHLLLDQNVSQAKVLNTPKSGDQEEEAPWAIVISRSDGDNEGREPDSVLVRRLRKSLVQYTKKLYNSDTRMGQKFTTPKKWIVLDRLPTLKDTGAVDTVKLQRMVLHGEEESSSGSESDRGKTTMPRTQLDLIVAAAAEVLGHNSADIDTSKSFVRQGGDSISAIELMARCAELDETLRLRVPDILLAESLEQLARLQSPETNGAAKKTPSPAPTIATTHENPFPLLQLSESELVRFKETTATRIVASSNGNGEIGLETAYPCTTVQEGILLAAIRFPESYRIERIFEVAKGTTNDPIDLELLEQAWRDVVAHHGALRTVFAPSVRNGAGFDQIVLTGVECDIRRLKESARDGKQAVQLLEQQQSATFSELRPAHRLTTCSTIDGSVFCKIEIHHSIVDGLSAGLLLKELRKAYSRRRIGGSATQTESYHLGRYIAQVRSNSLEEPLEYWTRTLSGLDPCHFPSLTSSDAPTTREDRTVQVNIASSQAQKFCKTLGITIPVLLQATWAVILRGYTQTDDVCFGYLASGRDEPVPGLQNMIGTFIHLLTCRVQFGFTDAATLTGLLHAIQKQSGAAIANQYCSLASIQNSLQLGGRSLFNTLLSFVYSSPDQAGTSDDDIYFKVAETVASSEYDVTLLAELASDTLSLSFTYKTTSLSKENAASLVDSFTHILQSITEHPDSQVSHIQTIGPKDLGRVFEAQGDLSPATEACTHWLIAQQVHSQPNGAAVASWDKDLTYSELDALASKLASRLRRAGVKPDDLVPICFPKSAWAVVAIVAVQQAGAGFVPLDPTAPQARLQGIRDDTKATVMLASTECQEAVELLSGLETLLFVDEQSVRSLEQNEAPLQDQHPQESVQPHHASFAIFTSGSTGKPKGMVISHGSFCTTGVATAPKMEIGPGTRVYQFSAFTFDVGIFDVLITLMHGGCICMPNEQERVSDLAGSINKLHAEVVYLTPTVAGLLNPDDVPSIQQLVLMGEAITNKTADKWRGKVVLHGAYGPSEASAAAWNTELGEFGASTANLGRPLATVFWVVDPRDIKQLVPVGCIGELLVEGPMLARGYLEGVDEKATANWLEDVDWLPPIQQSAWRQVKRRLYRTGDLVRQNGDGTFTFIGRKDTQIKLHGQRVEIGEIESRVLQAMPSTTNAMVDIVRGENSEPKYLAVFMWDAHANDDEEVHLAEPISPERQRLVSATHQYLAKVLPRYMMPSSYLILDGTPPRTSSGKVNRRHLVSLVKDIGPEERLKFAPEGQHVVGIDEPTTRLENEMRTIWAAAIGIENLTIIGRHTDFFALGGDSIGAMKLVNLAARRGLVLNVATVFKAPQLKDMAAATLIDGKVAVDAQPFQLLVDETDIDDMKQEVARMCDMVSSSDIVDVYPCTTMQIGLMALSYKQPTSYTGRIVFTLPSDIDVPRFKQAWRNVMLRNAMLRTRIVDAQTAGMVQVVLKAETMPWIESDDLDDYLRRDVAIPMATGKPLSRYALIQPKDSRGISFVWTAHHAMYDGPSLRIVAHEVNALYNNGTSDLEDPIPFTRFIQHTQSIAGVDAASFWHAQLEGSSRPSFPPTAKNSDDIRKENLVTHSMPLPRHPDSHITTTTLLRAAWAIVQGKYSRTDDVLYGAVVTGRGIGVQGIESIVGPTVNTVPIRVRLDPSQMVHDYLRRLQEATTDMLAYEQYGLQNIARLGDGAENVSSIQTLLVLQTPQEEGSCQATTTKLLDLGNAAMHGANFHTHAFILEGIIDEPGKSLRVNISFDNNVLSEAMHWHPTQSFRTMCRK
ncbi:NRPS [Purpureocillium takamizusanense]|uniref:NRPS n=1 Tax=Purpureocillium takamizusanense TaxID=2060973 RepID=A0A9Q8QAB3_9HYPO|nr:NRPS [Purpureocillium takamizusanense]UNI16433.1 NRPS [Purpureocillium takamizusanense]